MPGPILPPAGESMPTEQSVVAPETPEGVFAAVEDALHRTFGVDGQVERNDGEDDAGPISQFTFAVAGTKYLMDIGTIK